MGFLSRLFGLGESKDYKELIDQGARIIDVRTPQEFAMGHAKGSVNIPLQQFGQSVKKIKKKDTDVILCCKSGMRASQARQMLKGSSFNVYNAGSWKKVNY